LNGTEEEGTKVDGDDGDEEGEDDKSIIVVF
jgi:hypothetical protein